MLGLPASLASLAILLSLVVDAVSDPLVGSFSDNLRHRLGRRHPLMYGSLAPLSLGLYLLFAPPAWGQDNLFVWLLAMTVVTRLAFTFFAIPWNALFSELSDDYQERSILLAWRFGVGWIVGVSFIYGTYDAIFVATPAFPQGQLNPAAYQPFALVLAGIVFVAGLASTWLTRDQIPYLRQPTDEEARFEFKRALREILLALQNRDFLFLFLAVLASSVIIGTNQAFDIYMTTYFWGFSGEQLRFMSLTLFGGLVAFLTIGPLQRTIDKKYLLVGCSIVIMFTTAFPVTLKLLGLAPPTGSTALVVLVVSVVAVNAYLATVALIMFGSMIADTIDLQELKTGLRQEGLFNSAISFSAKATNGVGLVIAGLLLDFVAGIPAGAAAGQITEEAVFRVAILDAYVVPLGNIAWLILALKYSITREQHAEIRAKLDEARNQGAV